MAWEVRYKGPHPAHTVQARNCITVTTLLKDVWVSLAGPDALRAANFFAEQDWCDVRSCAGGIGDDYASDQPSARLLAASAPTTAADAPARARGKGTKE